jgi:hypothetical protein
MWQRAFLTTMVLMFMPASWAGAQEWAKVMFDATSHDFGTIAQGKKVEHRFTIENKYDEDVHIASVSSGCGCVTQKIDKQLLKPHEKAELVAVFDPRAPSIRKESALTVVFDKPFSAEVQVVLRATIRNDIAIEPSVLQFGSITQGKESQQEATIHCTGRKDWKILKAEPANPNLQATLTETDRKPDSVDYSLSVTLKPDAPLGYPPGLPVGLRMARRYSLGGRPTTRLKATLK